MVRKLLIKKGENLFSTFEPLAELARTGLDKAIFVWSRLAGGALHPIGPGTRLRSANSAPGGCLRARRDEPVGVPWRKKHG